MNLIEKAKRAGQIAQQIEALNAELTALFGEAPPPEKKESTPEPEPEPAAEAPAPTRRGRPPGSKNRPKEPEPPVSPPAQTDDLPWDDTTKAETPAAPTTTEAGDDFTTF